MKVAISINCSWNIYNFRMGLVKALLQAGHEVIAIAPEDDYTNYLKDIGCSIELLKVENTGSNPIKDIKLIYSYYQIYKKVNPDVILQYTIKPNIYGTLAAKKLSIPVINNISGLGTVFLNDNIVSKVAKQLYKLAFRNVDLVFFQNADDKIEFLKEISIPEHKTDLLPGSGINLNEFVPLPKVNPSTFNFLMISRVIIDKGIYEYVEAAKLLKSKLKDVSFKLLGEMDENHKRGILESEVASWHDNNIIEYLGSTDNVESVIRESDCIVLPSYREGTPRTLLEGAAMAKPLIATDVPGCRHVVEDGRNGFLCDVKSGKSLSEAMLKMHECSKEEIQAFGEQSRALVEEKFDEEIVVERYLHWIFKLTNKQAVSTKKFNSNNNIT